MIEKPDFTIEKLGECRIPSPMKSISFQPDDQFALYDPNLDTIKAYIKRGEEPPVMELAGPREKIYFDPSKLKAGIVTCGGLCPGLNDVIRAIVMSLTYHYGVRDIFGFPFGYEGLSHRYAHRPIKLTPHVVKDINRFGGTFLGSSRGPQDVSDMVDTLEQMNIGILFTIGGDGTLRGGQAIDKEIRKRGLKKSVIGIPKTIDNDISYIDRSFGFLTAGSEARKVIAVAHSEAYGARNGIGLVKLMGRESGFIAAFAALADNEVNFCLVPEVPFALDAFLHALDKRLEEKNHAVIVVAEGAGQDILEATGKRDASGNVRPGDIGIFLRDSIIRLFSERGDTANIKYIDPSYMIRAVPADAADAAFCLFLGHNAVHAAMTGRTNMVVGSWMEKHTHIPISLAVSSRKKIDPAGRLWSSVIASTGQPEVMR